MNPADKRLAIQVGDHVLGGTGHSKVSSPKESTGREK
jgi:hypothetical protein